MAQTLDPPRIASYEVLGGTVSGQKKLRFKRIFPIAFPPIRVIF
jgi:hypothetical protein